MNNTITVFFFTSSNHISNVKTLQSIYKQDYPHIHLIVCNDSTYGFENERFFYNLNHQCPRNIEHIIFQENRKSLGEFQSQSSFWDKISEGLIITLHSGEYFTSTSALSKVAQRIESNNSIAGILYGCECWDNRFKKVLNRYAATDVLNSICDTGSSCGLAKKRAEFRDCMVIYQVSMLREVLLHLDERRTHISNALVPWLVSRGYKIITSTEALCRYSAESIDPMIKPIPDVLGNVNLQKISALINETK